MKAGELQDWLLADGICEELALIMRATVLRELEHVSPEEELSGQLEKLNWQKLLFAGSILTKSDKRPAIEAALRIATAALSLSTVAAIIKARIAYHNKRGRRVDLPKLIRGTMEIVEQTARFRAPKYLSAYMDVLKLHLTKIGRQDLISDEMDVGIALEFGVSTRTLLSLMELGISRMSAVALNEKIALDNLSREECEEWIREHNEQFDGMDIPAIIVEEIRRKVIGIEPESLPQQETSPE